MINRKITPHLQAMARFFPAVTILGPRQSGKTTLAKQVFPGHTYVCHDSRGKEVHGRNRKEWERLKTEIDILLHEFLIRALY